MDELKIKGNFFEKIAGYLLKKLLAKKLGIYSSNVAIKDLDISIGETTSAKAFIEISLEKSSTDLLKNLLKRNLKED